MKYSILNNQPLQPIFNLFSTYSLTFQQKKRGLFYRVSHFPIMIYANLDVSE